jgi:hypothetical protein
MSVRIILLALAGVAFLAGPAAAGPGKRANADRLVKVVYPVADLVVPIDYAGEGKKLPTHEKLLLDLIRGTVVPSSWAERGGKGTIEYFPTGMALVVNQTAGVQAEINDLLAALRRLQSLQVAVEMRIVSLPEPMAERFCADVEFTAVAQSDSEEPLRVAFLNPTQMKTWTAKWQEDRRTNVMLAPKITGLSGQMLKMRVTEQQAFVTGYNPAQVDGRVAPVAKNQGVETGLTVAVTPTISADRKSVRVGLNARLAALSEPTPKVPATTRVAKGDAEEQEFTGEVRQPKVESLNVEGVCNIADGGSAVLVLGKRLVEGRREFGPSLLSEVPYINRLFRNVGYGRETQTVFVVISPRVLVTEEREARV